MNAARSHIASTSASNEVPAQEVIAAEVKPQRQIDKNAADAAVLRANQALSAGKLSDAKAAFVQGLLAHPGLISVYHAIGNMCAELDLVGPAELCYRGQLPDFLSDEWFGSSFEPSNIPTDASTRSADSVTRNVCHLPQARSLSLPKGIVEPLDQRFHQKNTTSSQALVDHAAGGSVWFDGFNRVMLDARQQCIPEHTLGNPALIKKVLDSTEPKQIPGRAFFVGGRGYSNYYHWMLDILPSFA